MSNTADEEQEPHQHEPTAKTIFFNILTFTLMLISTLGYARSGVSLSQVTFATLGPILKTQPS